MPSPKGRIPAFKGVPLTRLPDATFKKFVYRKVEMRRYGMRCGDSRLPAKQHGLRLELLGPDRFDEVFHTNPHMDGEDRERFLRQESTCIVAWDGSRVASSTWMTKGDVYVHELQRAVHIPSNEHLSCRSYVDPDYRGLALMSHMIHAYSERQPADDEVWGFVFAWNIESVRSLERIGWRYFGDDWTRFVLGRRFPGQRSFAPRPPTTVEP